MNNYNDYAFGELYRALEESREYDDKKLAKDLDDYTKGELTHECRSKSNQDKPADAA